MDSTPVSTLKLLAIHTVCLYILCLPQLPTFIPRTLFFSTERHVNWEINVEQEGEHIVPVNETTWEHIHSLASNILPLNIFFLIS